MPQTQNNQIARRISLSSLITLGVVALVSLLGLLFGNAIDETAKKYCLYAALILVTIPLAIFAIHYVMAKSYAKSQSKLNSAEQQEIFASRREQAANDIQSVITKIKRIHRFMIVYSLIYIALGGTSIFFGMACKHFYFLIAAVFVYFPLLRLIPDKENYDFSDYSSPNDYPIIHDLAYKVSNKLGLKGKIRIIFLQNNNAAIARIGKTYSLQLGNLLLDVLTEEELEQVLIHEFAHLTVDDVRMSSAASLYFRIINNPKADRLYAYIDGVFTYEYSMYLHAATITLESRADRAVIEHGNPSIAANALAKTAYLNLFQREMYKYISEPYLEPEEKRNNLGEILVNSFRTAVSERKDFWKSILLNEIQARNASHPILRNRLQSIGSDDFNVIIPNYDGEFRKECLKARRETDEIIYKNDLENYGNIRTQNYLEPLKIIEVWKADGEPLSAEKTREVIMAFRALLRFDEQEKLCDRIIAEEENIYAKAYAIFVKGSILLDRYDNEGIKLIYDAMELNSYYIPSGLQAIGDYCCLMGLHDELNEYRQKANDFSDNELKNISHARTLTANDHLVKDDMPAEMQESILDYIKSINEDVVSQVFLVKKVVSEDFSISSYVIKFLADTNDETIERVMNSIFEHLDTHPSGKHFSLFVYDKTTENAVKKVKGSCVYHRY